MHRFLSIFLIAAFANAAEFAQFALLMGEPATTVVADKADRKAMTAAVKAISATRANIRAELDARQVSVMGSTELLVNAVYVYADAGRRAELLSLPGVVAVVRLPRVKRSLDRAIQLTNVPAAWNLLNGVSNAGAGVKIGVIDTGIESTHPAFQDPTLKMPAGYPICAGSDCLYTNNKVIVARSYVKFLAAGFVVSPAIQVDPATDRPDDISARDRDGHGTAVAMAAAGVTTPGPAATITGVAPKAYLGSYKVFGSPGLNDFSTAFAVNRALEDAFADNMDIIVYSSGSPALTGPLDTGTSCLIPAGSVCDVIALAVDNAVKAGKVVVVAAGNYGDQGTATPVYQSVTSPATAPNAIAVGASSNSHSFYNVVTVGVVNPFSPAVPYRGSFGNGPIPAARLTAPLSDMLATGDATGCTTPTGTPLAGTIALVARGNCTFLNKVQNAVLGGAVGVIFTNDQGDNSLFSPTGLNGTTIPSLLVGYDDGQAIRASLRNVPGSNATFDPNPVAADSTANQTAAFSSRGPATGSFDLKPDVTAPGTGIYLAAETYDPAGALYSPSGFTFGDGTSFSAPIVAGAAALVRQARPNLPATSLRSSIINTATQDVTGPGGAAASVLAVGAGKLNAAAAVNNNLIVSPATVSFGVIDSLPKSLRISLTNIGATPLTLAIAINRRTTESNAKTSIDTPNLTLAPGATNSFNFALTGGKPAPGIYEGLLTVAGAAGPIVIPYVYQVGDGVPYNVVSLAGDGDEGNVSDYPSEQLLAMKVTDRFGVPVTKYPVRFGVVSGGGRVVNPDPATDAYGIAYATPLFGSTPGPVSFFGSVGGITVSFNDTARLKPTISGAVNAASYEAGKAVAAGSYIALFGTGLSDVPQSANAVILPVVLSGVSVSFDAPGISVPGHLYYVGPTQVNVQVPWELAGQATAQMKVSVGYSIGALYTLPVAVYAPAMFEYPVGIQLFAAARDENFQLVTLENAAKQGRTIQIYCNGLGPVLNRPASGDAASSTSLSPTTTNPIVTIGGLPAIVSFSGLTPTTSSLYQLNVVVPNTGTGIQPVTVQIGGVISKTSAIAVQ